MSNQDKRAVELIEIELLRPAPRNARTHSKKQIKQIAKSIDRFGFTSPVLIDGDNGILAGHGRVAAAKLLGMSKVLCLRFDNMTAVEKRAYILADNKVALNASWDIEILAGELKELAALDFDVQLTGFEIGEADLIIDQAEQSSVEPAGPEDHHPAISGPAITRPGDMWILGRHTMKCGDAKCRDTVDLLVGGRQVDMVFTDPPYNIKIDGHVSGLGRIHHREFVEASGEMSKGEFTAFLSQSLATAAAVCRDGAIAYICMDWRHLGEVLEAGYGIFSELKNVCVWAKTNGGMGAFYRSQHEMVLVWKVGTAPHTNTFGLGDKGRYRTNVWTYPGVNTFKSGRMAELAAHPTSKPVALVADAIRDVSKRGDTVLDVFGGSGTTLIAAEKTGRTALILELDPLYCDVIIRRWERLTGKEARLASTGEPFEAVKNARLPCDAGQTNSEMDIAA